jgi:hypothetical protein
MLTSNASGPALAPAADPIAARFEALARMKTALATVGLPFDDLRVFGQARCNVHVRCLGRTTAEKWAAVLRATFAGAQVRVAPHVWNAAQNKGTCLLPTKRVGYLVTVAA